MPTLTPSRILDTDTVTTYDTDTPKVCDFAMLFARWSGVGKPDKALEVAKVEDECGKAATHQVMSTCCKESPIRYRCDEHAAPFARTSACCTTCLHMCWPGVCYHRIITPL